VIVDEIADLIGHNDHAFLRTGLARFRRFGGLFQDLFLAINAQNLSHLLLELGVALFQRLLNQKREIHERTPGSTLADFMEAVRLV
jgi:hypothetical protein